jgi:glutamate--cysteine ligase
MGIPEAVSRAFAPSTAGRPRIGAELELHLVGRDAPPPVDSVSALLGAEFVRRARPTFEPGGQLELSPAPQHSASALVEELEWCLRSVPIPSMLAGVNPRFGLAEVPLARPTPRYLAMQELFDDHGDAGRRMMRLTASLQVCVDLLPGPAGREQWVVANLAGPALVAAYSGIGRTAIWNAMDPARTAYDWRHLDVRDPVGSYAAFASAASRLPIPQAADDDYHLGTIFPPVRPRGGYLEIRYLDARRPSAEVLGTLWTLLYDDAARREALDLLLPTFTGSWDAADPTDLLAITSGDRREAA